MTRQAALERNGATAVPLLGLATPLIGHFQIRNRGTVGGSIAHADPAAELPAVTLTLDATLEVTSTSGTKDVAAADFFVGTWTTAARRRRAAQRDPVPDVVRSVRLRDRGGRTASRRLRAHGRGVRGERSTTTTSSGAPRSHCWGWAARRSGRPRPSRPSWAAAETNRLWPRSRSSRSPTSTHPKTSTRRRATAARLERMWSSGRSLTRSGRHGREPDAGLDDGQR